MLNLTLEETIENHRKMWRWIADETLKQKRKVEKMDYFLTFFEKDIDIPFSLCYCCNYVKLNFYANNKTDCSKCPLEWPDKNGFCLSTSPYSNSQRLFDRWYVSKNYLEASNLARQIANLPVKEVYQNGKISGC